MAARDHFVSRPGDILLATLPKVGTTWLKALTFATLNRITRGPFPQSTLLSLNPHQCVPCLEYQLYSDNRIPNLDALPSARLLATHIPYSLPPDSVLNSKNSRIVFLCRNPRDKFISMWKFTDNLIPNTYEPLSLDEFLNVFLSGVYTSGPFWDNVLECRRASVAALGKVLFLKSEELKRGPNVQLKTLAEFMGCPFSAEEEEKEEMETTLKLCRLESLRGLEVNQMTKTAFWSVEFDNKAFFRKGEVGDWINHLTPEMVERFGTLMRGKFEGTGLPFE